MSNVFPPPELQSSKPLTTKILFLLSMLFSQLRDICKKKQSHCRLISLCINTAVMERCSFHFPQPVMLTL